MDGDAEAADCDGHGTHVASTAVGRSVGVARGAELVAVRVLDCSGSGSIADTVAGAAGARGDGGPAGEGAGGACVCMCTGRRCAEAVLQSGGDCVCCHLPVLDVCNAAALLFVLPHQGIPPGSRPSFLCLLAPPLPRSLRFASPHTPYPTGLDWLAKHVKRPAVAMLSLGVPAGACACVCVWGGYIHD